MLNETKRNNLQKSLHQLQSEFRDALRNREIDAPEVNRLQHQTKVRNLQEQISLIEWE